MLFLLSKDKLYSYILTLSMVAILFIASENLVNNTISASVDFSANLIEESSSIEK